MKIVGIIFLVLGALMFAAALISFGTIFTKALEARRIKSIPLFENEKITTDPVTVNTDRLCQIAVYIHLKTKAVQEVRTPESSERTYEPRYRFPLSYKVLDGNGKPIYSEAAVAGWEASGYKSSELHYEGSPQEGITAQVEHSFGKFKVPSPGVIRVEVELKPDTQYGAPAKEAELRIYDNVSAHEEPAVRGCILVALGPAIGIVGIVLLVLGLLNRRPSESQAKG